MRRLIVNADDFGFTRDVNDGIARAFERGILRATTLMANGDAFDHAVETARALPGLDVGAHITLIGGNSVADPRRPLASSVTRLLAARRQWSRAALEEECCAQLEKILAAGITPTHVDAHKHTHLFPAVLDALLGATRRYGIRWVRRPFDVPLTAASARSPLQRRVTSRVLASLGAQFDRKMEAAGLRTTDAFAGFQLTGLYRAEQLAALIAALPPGVTEFMCHPGVCGPELLAASTRLKQSRERELDALTSGLVLRAAADAQVEITSFRALSDAPAPAR